MEEKKPCMKITLTDTKPSIFESKVGGIGYIPHDADFPKDSKGNQLRLLAQIECEKIQLDEFPKKGLLQFWILNDDVAGINDDNGFRVIYYPETDKSVTEEDIMKKFVRNEFDDNKRLEHLGFTIYGEYGMSFEKSENYSDTFHQIGGYPYFVQYDIRMNDYNLMQKYDFLLFQLNTEWDGDKCRIEWCDTGVGNFFISTEKLKNLDFSDILYSWDCC